jgi:hypothetical protein
MIEVFKTNVQEVSHANEIIAMLLEHLPGSKINFDMHDCDKVLRVEGNNYIPEKIIALVQAKGFNCSPLQ